MKNSHRRPINRINFGSIFPYLALLAAILFSACQAKPAPPSPTASPTPLPTLAPTPAASPTTVKETGADEVATATALPPTPTGPGEQITPTGDPAAYLASGKAYLEAGEVTKAIADLEAATSVQHEDLLEAQFYLGNAYIVADRLTDAEAQFLAVLESEPDHLSARSNLGVVYLRTERIEDAQAEFQVVLASDETDAEVHYLLGVTYVRLTQLETAREQFEQAIALKPDLPEPYFGLGTLYYLDQEPEKAIEAFEAFLSRGPAQDPAAEEEARRMLAELKGQ
jgi:tetratricopeptide (TPR) repeat protein